MNTWLHNPASQNCTIIAEVAQSHDGSLGMAHAFIDAVAKTGADAIKFQTHIAAAESTPGEPWRKKFSLQDVTRYDYWKRMEFSESQWQGLKNHAVEKGLLFLSSPFSLEAVELLKKVGMTAWKIASGEISNSQMLKMIAATKQPVMISTGMSDLHEVDRTVALLKPSGVPLALMQCATIYPCPPEAVGLNVIDVYKKRYQTAVGLSDHSATIYAGLAAASMGIQVLEVHVTLSPDMFGPDVIASLTTAELKQLVDGVRFIEKMLANPVNKQILGEHAAPLRKIFMKSVVAKHDLLKGHILSPDDMALKKPGGGLTADDYPQLIGKRLRKSIAKDEMILKENTE